MIAYIRARLGERSTKMGLAAVLLAGALLGAAFFAPPETYANVSDAVKWLAGALFVGGMGGVFWPEKAEG